MSEATQKSNSEVSVQKKEKEKTDVMFEEIGKKLRLGFVNDLRKPNLDKFERAAIIRRVAEEHNWSIRQMARELGFSKSTLEDWLLFENITEDRYQILRSSGVSEAEIYRQLRDNSKTPEGKKRVDAMNALDYKLAQMSEFIRRNAMKGPFTKETLTLCNDLRNSLTMLEQAVRKAGK